MGPTGSGKSSRAWSVAARPDTPIINADAQQVYRSLPTLRATPRASPQLKLYSFLDDHQTINAVQWAECAYKILPVHGKDAVIVGGTALYVQTLLEGAPPVPTTPPEIRQQVGGMTTEALTELVLASAPEFRFRDRHRLERAASVYLATDRPITWWQSLPRKKYSIGKYQLVCTDMPTRAALHTRILEMIDAGALAEVAQLMQDCGARDYATLRELIAVVPIGLQPACEHLTGAISQGRMVEIWTDRTYQYARRQRTFFGKLLRKFGGVN